MTNVVPLICTSAVDSAWEAYCQHAGRSRADPDLLHDREYVEQWARLESRFKRLFLAEEAGK